MQRTLLFWAMSLAILAGGTWFVCPQGECAATAFDRVGLGFAHALRGELLDGWMPGITWIGSLAVLLPITSTVSLVLVYSRRRREAGFLMLALLGAAVLGHLAKLMVARTHHHQLCQMAQDGSAEQGQHEEARLAPTSAVHQDQ